MFWFDHRRQLAVLVSQGLCDEAFVFLGKRFKFDVTTAATSIVDNLESTKKKKNKQKKEDLIFSSFLSPKLNTFNCRLQMYIQVINTNRLRISVWLFSNICHRLAGITRD